MKDIKWYRNGKQRLREKQKRKNERKKWRKRVRKTVDRRRVKISPNGEQKSNENEEIEKERRMGK